MQIAKITDHKFLIRDMYSKAILNTDESLIRQHEKYMLDKQKEKDRVTEINNLKKEIIEIKELLKMLLGNRNG